MHPIQLWPVMTVLGVILLGGGIAYGLARAGGGKRIGDSAAEAGAKAPVSNGARTAAVASAVVGALLLLGAGVTAWQYEVRSGVDPSEKTGAAHIVGQASTAELQSSVTTGAPNRNVQGVTDPRKAETAQAFENRSHGEPAPQGQAPSNG